MQGLKAAFHRRCPDNGPSARWPLEAPEVLLAEVLILEQVTEQFVGALCDNHGVRLSKALQSSCQIRRLPHNGLFLRGTGSDKVTDHDQSARDTHTCLQG
jgi:hypothetical protein